jgi:hypothetical protein
LQPVEQTITPTATDADGICLSQTPLSAGALTLNGVLVSGGVAQIGAQQYLTITCAGADAGRTFTIVADGRTGQRFTFTQAGENVGATTSTLGVYRVISVSVDAATAGAITVGVVGQGRQYPIVVDNLENPTTISVSADVTAGGGAAIDYTVQHSFNDPYSGNPDSWTWFPIGDSAMVGATAHQNSNYAYPPRSIAVLINSVTGAPSLVFRVIQAARTP